MTAMLLNKYLRVIFAARNLLLLLIDFVDIFTISVKMPQKRALKK